MISYDVVFRDKKTCKTVLETFHFLFSSSIKNKNRGSKKINNKYC
jgi:hypothetical protein